MDIYIKPVKKIKAEGKRVIHVKDIAEVYVEGSNAEKIKNIVLLDIKSEKRGNYLISIMDIIKAVTNCESKATVINTGETDIVVDFSPKIHSENKIIVGIKIAIVAIVLFFGAATAIMSFHSDAEIPQILKGYYNMFFEDDGEIPYIIEIPYSIGLAVGIIIFFNHFSVVKMSSDPTPIEVQMTTYEKEVVENQIETLEKKKEKN